MIRVQVIFEGSRRRNSDPNSCFEVQTTGRRQYLMQAKSSGDANMWIRAMRQHTARETPNQIMDRAEAAIQAAEETAAVNLAHHAFKLRKMQAQQDSSTASNVAGPSSQPSVRPARVEDNAVCSEA